MDSVHHIWCPLSSQEFQDLPDGAETTLTLKITIVAEGVETLEEWCWLQVYLRSAFTNCAIRTFFAHCVPQSVFSSGFQWKLSNEWKPRWNGLVGGLVRTPRIGFVSDGGSVFGCVLFCVPPERTGFSVVRTFPVFAYRPWYPSKFLRPLPDDCQMD